MAKKNFKNNPVMNFISQPDPEPTPPVTSQKAPEGYKINPAYIETKSKRVQILIQPSVYDSLKAKAKDEGISTNEAINEAIRRYTGRE